MRNAEEALRRGDFEIIHTNDDAGTFGFRRATDTDTLLVLLNRGELDTAIILEVNDSEQYEQVMGTALQGTIRATGDGSLLTVSLPDLGGVVLKKFDRSGSE